MSEPFLGEIRYFPYARPPRGWRVCDGALLSIPSNSGLFGAIGTTYGGNGTTTFALPDLRGRVLVHRGLGPGRMTRRVPGETGGTEQVTLFADQMPAHTHQLRASTAAAVSTDPTGRVPAKLADTQAMYVTNTAGTTSVAARAGGLGGVGQGQPHENCAPTITLLACIAVSGIFPTRQ